MKPSASKAAVAARQRKSRALKKEKTENVIRHAAQMDALPVAERIQIDQITKQVGIDRVAQKKARAAALIALAEREALKEPLTVTTHDSAGNQRQEQIHIPQEPSRWELDREREQEFTKKQSGLDVPGRPPPGKPMSLWTMSELAAHKLYNQLKFAPRGASHPAQTWDGVQDQIRREAATDMFGWPIDSI